MATRDTKKFLKDLNKYIDSQVRGKLDKFTTIVTMTSTSLGQGFKEGYSDIFNKTVTDLPEISDSVFTKIGKEALDVAHKHVTNPRTRPHLIEYTGDTLVYSASRDFKNVYTKIKNKGVAELNKHIKSTGGRGLRGVRDYDGKVSARATEVGIVKSGIHRAHQGVTTVGSAQLSGAMEFLSRTRDFAGFATNESAEELMALFEDVNLYFTTTGTKTGGGVVSLNENMQVGLFLGPRSRNKAGDEPYDWKNLKPILERAVENYLNSIPLEKRSGSKSIEDNAVDATEHAVFSVISKGRRKSGKTSKSKRNKKDIDEIVAKKPKKRRGSTKRATALKRKEEKGVATAPLALIGIINKELPRVVQKNMVAPRLQYQTGRFASSVRVTDMAMTAKGFPSIGYTYDRDNYETFELGNRQGSPDRDPRALIDTSIREIAARYAIGRFYTRRV